MTQITNFIQYFLPEPVLWGIAIAGCVFAVFMLGRWRWRSADPHLPPIDLDFEEADAWLPPSTIPEERRAAIRRDASLVEVAVADPKRPKKVLEGVIVNRSTLGVRLAVKATFPSGSVVKIRAVNAPQETPWTSMIVRHSEEVDDYFKLGCQFEEKVPWNILLMFG